MLSTLVESTCGGWLGTFEPVQDPQPKSTVINYYYYTNKQVDSE